MSTSSDDDRWEPVARSDEVLERNPLGVEVAGEEVAIFRIEGQLYATHNICTHNFARLCDGYLEGYEIECPMHQGRFDVRTGRPTREPCEEPIPTYEIRETDGVVEVEITPRTT